LADNRIVQERGEQQHARKFHSYFLVFQKKKPSVKYEPPQISLSKMPLHSAKPSEERRMVAEMMC
jgi:hypothetical protein